MHVVGMVEFHEGVERGFPVGVPTHFEILDDPIFVERIGLQMLGQHVEMNEERLDLGVHNDENKAVTDKTGRATCRERGSQYVKIWVVAGTLKKKKKKYKR